MLCTSDPSFRVRTVDRFHISIFDGVNYCDPAIKPHIPTWGADHSCMNANSAES